MAELRKNDVEGILMAIALFIFGGYNAWLLFLRSKIHRLLRHRHCRRRDFFASGKLGRSIFSETCASDPKDAILAIQQARNAMTASTYLATVSSILATAGITIILDPTKTNQVQQLALKDPILRHFPGEPLTTPQAVIMCSLVALYSSFLCFAQSIRLYVHWGYYVRAMSSPFNLDAFHMDDVRLVVIRAGMAFTIGMRLFFLFIILILWSGGITWMLIGSIVVTAFSYWFDMFDTMQDRGPQVVEAQEEALEQIERLERGETLARTDASQTAAAARDAGRRSLSVAGSAAAPIKEP